jgi:Flp pilus assembly protein TadG
MAAHNGDHAREVPLGLEASPMQLVRFFRDRKGGVAPLLALGLVPLVGAVGAAVDYSRASNVRAAMQAAADATALMLAKTASTLTPNQLQQNANSYFLANFSRPEANNVQVQASYTQGQTGFNVTVSGTANVSTAFMGLIGLSQIALSTTGTVGWNNSKLRVALVLDNTGSMSQYGKLSALQTASHNLLTQLQNAAQTDGDVYVSIIPFVKDVNAGASNYNATWIDWTDWDAANGTCSNTSYTSKSSCTSHGKTWTPKNHNTWNGCITDRDQNYDTVNTAPMSGANFPAEQYSYCPVSLMGLSYDWTALNNKINAMVANGSTNQNIGLAWGWQSLTNPPLTVPPMDPNYQYQQIIILLTDGLNTQDRWYGNGYQTSTQVDARQQITCNNINAAGITLYTVQVNTDGDPTSTLLQNCAGSPGKYPDSSKFFLLTSASQIITTFNTIGTSLQKLYLAK